MMTSVLSSRCSKQVISQASSGPVRRFSYLASTSAWKQLTPRSPAQYQSRQRFDMMAFALARTFASGPPTQVLSMPSLSPTMTQGNLSAWKVKVGDIVRPGTVLATIETDKASMDFEAQEEGYVAKLLVESGTNNVQVGQPIIVLVEEAEHIAQLAETRSSSLSDSSVAAVPAAPPKATPAHTFPPHQVLEMPSLSPTMTTGNIAAWRVKIGDYVKPGTILAEIETDKATMDFECQEEGYIAKLLVSHGSKDVSVGKPILVLAENKNTLGEFDLFTLSSTSADAQAPAKSAPAKSAPAQATAPASTSRPVTPQQTQQPQQTATKTSTPGQRIIASPLAKKVAAERGVDLSVLVGSGPDGRIIHQDVLNAKPATQAASQVTAPQTPAQATAAATAQRFPTIQAAAGSFTEIPHTNIRRIIAQKLTEAKQSIPHFYLSIDCNMDNLVQLRARINAAFGESTKVSVNDLILKACACALREVPGANASFHQDSVRVYDYVDISVAMQTDAGLLVPVVRGVHAKGLHDIARATKLLGEKGKSNKLSPQEMEGGTFTVSNLGMFGVKNFSAIINPPQACILAVGATEDRPLVVDGKVEVHKVMSVTLSCDHRVVDGVLGAKWLQAFKKFIEDPTLMLL